MTQFTGNQSIATARILLQVVKYVLDQIVAESESAVAQVTEQLNNMSELTTAQRASLASALEDFYHGAQGSDFKDELNTKASEILEAASAGDFAKVNEIGDSADYVQKKTKTKNLHDSLQDLIDSSDQLSENIFPLLIALQFQDKMKQELMGVLAALELFLQHDRTVVELDGDFDEFWDKVRKGFNVVETRNAVLKIVKDCLAGKVA